MVTGRWLAVAALLLVALVWIAIPVARAVALVANVPRPSGVAAMTGLDLETVRFESADGVRLEGSLAFAGPGAPVVVLVHGFKSDRAEMLAYATFLRAAGYSVLLFDRRGCGASEGWGIGLGATEDRDVVGAVRFARSRLGGVRVGVLGISLGAGIAIRTAAREPAIAAVVADSPWADEDFQLDRLATLRGVPLPPIGEGLVDVLAGTRVRDARPVDDIAMIAPRAVLLIRSADDDNATTSADAEARLFSAAREPKAEWIAPSGGHVGSLGAHPEEYERRVLEFLARYLRP